MFLFDLEDQLEGDGFLKVEKIPIGGQKGKRMVQNGLEDQPVSELLNRNSFPFRSKAQGDQPVKTGVQMISTLQEIEGPLNLLSFQIRRNTAQHLEINDGTDANFRTSVPLDLLKPVDSLRPPPLQKVDPDTAVDENHPLDLL